MKTKQFPRRTKTPPVLSDRDLIAALLLELKTLRQSGHIEELRINGWPVTELAESRLKQAVSVTNFPLNEVAKSILAEAMVNGVALGND